MNFLNPLVLFGLIAASIPLILHLLNLRKLKNIEFSSLKFLKELQKSKIRKVKIKQIILLIIRTLIIASIVLAFARPTIKKNLPFFTNYAQKSTIIVIDNSFSTDLSDENGKRFNQIKKAAFTILSSMTNGDEVVILPIVNNNFNINKYSFSKNLDLAKEELNKINILNSKGDLNKVLRWVSQINNHANNLNKEIYILSDAQKNLFTNKLLDSSKIKIENSLIHFYNISAKSKTLIKNLSIDSINLVSKIIQINKPIETECIIKNNSKSDVNGLIVNLKFNDETVAQRTLNVPANQSRQLNISGTPNKIGAFNASIELENDALDWDNKRFFGFVIPELPNIALISNNDIQFDFVKNALLASFGPEITKNIFRFNSKQINSIDNRKFKVIYLLDGEYQSADYLRLKELVQNGSGLFIFPSENTGIQTQEASFENLGFGRLRELNFNKKEINFQNIDFKHPIFDGIFKSNQSQKIISPLSTRIYLVNSGQSLMKFENSSILSESIIGEGKIIFLGITPDLKFGNFPLTGLFPSLIYKSVLYLNSSNNYSQNFNLGEPITLLLSNKYSDEKNIKFIDPNNNESYVSQATLPSGSIIRFDNLNQFGVYNLYTNDKKIIKQFSLNPDRTESDLTSVNLNFIENYFKNIYSDFKSFSYIDSPEKLQESIKLVKNGSELWQIFIILAIFLAIVELFIQKAYKNDIE